jgi:hypothetical protein
MPDEFAGLPELTVSLRSLGSSRGGARAEQGQFFGALLEARKRAASAKSMLEVIAAFNVARLGTSLDETLRALAAARFPDRPPARRAFEAELVDDTQPFYTALRGLRDATPVPGAAVSEESWQRWLGALRLVFEAADRAWRSIDVALARVASVRKPDSRGKSKGKGGDRK